MSTPLTLNGGHRIKFERERKICVLSEDHVAGKGRGEREREREIALSEKSTSNNRARVCAHARSFLLDYSKSFPEFTLIGDAARAPVCDSRNKVGIRSQRLIRRSVQINFSQTERKRETSFKLFLSALFHFSFCHAEIRIEQRQRAQIEFRPGNFAVLLPALLFFRSSFRGWIVH